MGVQVNLQDIQSGFLSAAAHTANNTLIETAFNKALDRTASTDNAMEVDLDMGNQKAINLKDGVLSSDAVNLRQLQGAIAAAGSGLISAQTETQKGSAASGQVFTFTGITYTVGGNNLYVFHNGVKLSKGRDYTETSSSSITLDSSITINSGDDFDFITNLATTNSTTDTSAITHTESGTSYNLATYLQNRHVVNVKDYGAVGDGVTDDTTAIGLWLDAVISTGAVGYVPDGVFLCDYITKAINNGIKIIGSGTIKATGSNRVNMIRFTGVQDRVEIDGVTFDANNKVARALEIQNTSSTSSTLGSVYISPKTRFINAKNNAPDTNTAIGLYIYGGFTDVTFEGEIDTVDSSSTSGAVSVGLLVSWSASATDDWVRNTSITSAARIRNVKNDNATLADADGLQCLAPTDKVAVLSVSSGALFENCKGRSIKSQAVSNSIISPTIIRNAYDGLSEINLQYAGGKVFGANVYHDGVRTDSIISLSQRPTPDNTQCSITANELHVTGSPSSNTGAMVATDVTDAAVKLQGVTVRDNKVHGTVDTMVSCRVANVIDVNRIVIDGNWAEAIATAFLTTTLYGSSRAQLTVVFTNNGCESACTGGSITNDLIVEHARNNHNISRLVTNPYTVTISSGAVTVYGSTHRVDTEASAATDDLDTITGNRTYEPDEYLQLYANNDARTVVLKDGTGNLRLNGDFSLNNIEDRIVLSYDGTNWCEISRSDNGA